MQPLEQILEFVLFIGSSGAGVGLLCWWLVKGRKLDEV